jgi:hypothetical protein
LIGLLLQKKTKRRNVDFGKRCIGRMQTNIEAKDRPSKRITLIALRTLKRLG